MPTKPHELIDEPCRCLHCKLNVRAIVLEVTYRLERDFETLAAEKMARRIDGEFKNFRNN